MNEPTTEKLAKALEEANAPEYMISRARSGYYDDFKSDLAAPISTLIADLRGLGLNDLAERAMNDEFCATDEEANQWFAKEGAYLIMHDLGLRPTKRPKPKGFGDKGNG